MGNKGYLYCSGDKGLVNYYVHTWAEYSQVESFCPKLLEKRWYNTKAQHKFENQFRRSFANLNQDR